MSKKSPPRAIGTLVAVFALTFLCSTSAEAQWAPNGAPICSATDYQAAPLTIFDGVGGAMVIWQDHRSGTFDIYAQSVNSSGLAMWPDNGVAICSTSTDQVEPGAVPDGVGGAIIVWIDHHANNADNPQIRVQRVNASGIAQWAPDGVVLCAASVAQFKPAIVADGSGGAIIAWADRRNGTDFRIYARRISSLGVPQGSGDGVLVCGSVHIPQDPLAIVADGNGGAIVGWDDDRSTWRRIYAQRVNALVVPQWTTDGVLLTSAATIDARDLVGISDGFGGMILAWWAYELSDNLRIRAQRIDPSGGPQWTNGGISVGGDQVVPTQYELVGTTDQAGGSIICWIDRRTSYHYDVYAQRVSASGVPLWLPSGTPVCTALNTRGDVCVTSDGFGGAVMAWHDERGAVGADIYSQRVSSSGRMMWAANGVLLCGAANEQRTPNISAGAGWGIVAWADGRAIDGDIYAQRVDLVTPPVTAVATPAPVTALLQNHPNPFNPSTTIHFTLPISESVELAIYDTNGQLVRMLVNDVRGYGEHEVTWNGRNETGAAAGSGVYFYRLRAGQFTESKKMVLLK